MKHADAAAGDLIDVTLGELHPTQPSLGYDEVFFRWAATPSVRTSRCSTRGAWPTGRARWPSADPDSTVADRHSFTCAVPVGLETPATTAGMKTVVIGPGGQVYLTDGHHIADSFWEVPGGGPGAHLRLRVVANPSST